MKGRSPSPASAVAPERGLAEPELVAALGEGDLAALAAAFDRWHHRIRVLARRLLSDPAAAEDVVQDVFTVLPRAVREVPGRRDLETFFSGSPSSGCGITGAPRSAV